MDMLRIGTATLVLATALGGCKKDGDDKADKADKTDKADKATGPKAGEPAAKPERGGGCAPLSLTVDGKPVTGLHPFAVTLKNGEYRTEQVELFDDATMTCERAMAGNPNLPPNAIEIRAYYHPQAMGMGTEAYTDLGTYKIELVKKATKVGDTTTLCLPAVSFTPNAGTLSGKKVEVSGTFEGPWCGVQDLTAK